MCIPIYPDQGPPIVMAAVCLEGGSVSSIPAARRHIGHQVQKPAPRLPSR